MGAGAPVLDCGVLPAASLAKGYGRNGFNYKLSAAEKLSFRGCPLPAIQKIMGDDRGNLTQLQRYFIYLRYVIFSRRIFQRFYDVKYNSKLVHNYFFLPNLILIACLAA